MKEGWEMKKLKEVLKIQNGYAFNSKQFGEDKGLQLIRIRDLKDGYKTVVKYDGDYDKKYIVKKGDFLIGMDGEFECYEWKGEDSLLNQRVCRLENFEESLLPKYLFHIINKYLKDIEDVTTYTTVKHISSRQIYNIEFPIPPLPEQKQIVAILDKAFAAIDQAQANIVKNIENARELFDSKREYYFIQLSVNNDLLPLNEVCEKIFAGGDKPKENFSKTPTEDLNIPIIANAVKDNGLYGFTNEAKVTKPSITVAARGSGTGHTEYRDYPFVPIVRLIVLTPNTDKIEVEFLMYSIKNLTISRSGSAIPQLTVPMIKSYSIPVPSKVKQKEIVESLNQLEIELEEYKSALERKNLDLEELKKSILQKAFSGELTQKPIAV